MMIISELDSMYDVTRLDIDFSEKRYDEKGKEYYATHINIYQKNTYKEITLFSDVSLKI